MFAREKTPFSPNVVIIETRARPRDDTDLDTDAEREKLGPSERAPHADYHAKLKEIL